MVSWRGLCGVLLAAAGASAQDAGPVVDSHEKLFLENRFPSATTCRTCHPDHFDEWSVSPHAYALMSPIFNAMHGTIVRRTNGTNGDFCIRCHTPVGMNLREPVGTATQDRHPTSREGVTCIACHRVSRAYGKISGRLALVEGSVFDPVYGPTGNAELERVLGAPDEYKVVTDPAQQGRAIHRDVVPFFELTRPGFCGTCHDVTLVNGFRLEEAFSEYKTSPAAARGVTCQDCHMGTEPGRPSGYAEGPAATVGGVPTRPRKRTNHRFAGPDHSVIHPGVYPFDDRAARLGTIAQWLQFDWKAGWGTDEFEDEVGDETSFPEHWASIDDRYDAREIIEGNLARLAKVAAERKAILQVGFQFGEVSAVREDGTLRIEVEVRNGTDGHSVPTGFIAERLVWLHVTVRDGDRATVYESGDLDPNGDVRDTHSLFVHAGKLPLDSDLFTLQSRFVTLNLRGGDREQVLAVNYSVDPLPFLRPDADPTSLRGRTLGARIQKASIGPNGRRTASYQVAADRLATRRGPFTVDVELKAGMVPVNLLAEIQEAGFDYGLSPAELARRVVAGHLVLWQKSVAIDTASGAGQ